MKKKILAITLFVAFSMAAFGGEKNPNKELFNELRTTMKTSYIKDSYSTNDDRISFKTFEFKGKVVTACYFDENGLIGFSIPYKQRELPQTIANAVSKKYSNCKIEDVVLFIDASANTNYFVQIKKGNTNLALQVGLQGQLSVYSRM